VEIDHGRVVSKEPAKLPEKASGLLTIFQVDDTSSKLSPLQALDALQQHLRLDAGQAAAWLADVQAARR
jgi:hypothetical protein